MLGGRGFGRVWWGYGRGMERYGGGWFGKGWWDFLSLLAEASGIGVRQILPPCPLSTTPRRPHQHILDGFGWPRCSAVACVGLVGAAF